MPRVTTAFYVVSVGSNRNSISVTTELTCKQGKDCIEAGVGCISNVASVIFCIRDIATMKPTLSDVARVGFGCVLLRIPILS